MRAIRLKSRAPCAKRLCSQELEERANLISDLLSKYSGPYVYQAGLFPAYFQTTVFTFKQQSFVQFSDTLLLLAGRELVNLACRRNSSGAAQTLSIEVLMAQPGLPIAKVQISMIFKAIRGQIPDAWHMTRYDLPHQVSRKLWPGPRSPPKHCPSAQTCR